MSISKRLKTLREERKLSQGDLAKLAKIHPVQISKYENDKAVPSPDNLKMLAKILQVTVDYLLFDGQKKEEVEFNNPVLKEKFLLINKMNKKDQEAITRILDGMILKNKVKSAAAEVE